MLFYEGTVFIYQLRYLFDYSSYYSPWLQIIGQKVRRVTPGDLMMQAKNQVKSQLPPMPPNLSWLQTLVWWIRRFSTLFRSYFKWFLLIALLAFKFLEWWYSPSNRLKSNRRLPIPPPPPPSKPSQSGIPVPADQTICPICRQVRTNPAATNTGFVFCYRCIFSHVSEQGKCPVTLLPCTAQQIRRIYDQ